MVQVQRYGSGQRCGSGSNIWFEVKVIVKGQKIWFEFKDGSRSKIWLVVKDMVRGQRYG